MNETTLGRLEQVDLRDIWATEAQDFTPWLARPENLQVLADTIKIDLELEAQEKNVGLFRADILCKDTDGGSWVLIENQLERTDHNHLGQLLTYASGLHAVTIVWVSARFTDEHRATLDWLNEITDEEFRFFGLEVELWRIGESPAAPKFNVVSKPNDWTRSVSQAARRIGDEALSETKVQHLTYWTRFRELLQERNSEIRPKKPMAQHWAEFGVGRSGFVLSATVHTGENRIGAELFIRAGEAKPYFHLLAEQKEDIEQEFGEALDWQELPERKGSRIAIYKSECDPSDAHDWPRQQGWLVEKLETFHRVFRDRIRALNAEDWQPDDAETAE